MAKQLVRIRKAPKLLPFLLLFAVIGLITALVLNSTISDEVRTAQPIFGYLVVWLTLFGGVVGLIVALIWDNVSRLRAKTVDAERSR
jgi:hypothetical protein